MAFETVTGTAPSYWASYFINGDASGMEDDEIAAADAFAEWLGGNIVDCEDAGFMHYHDAHRFGIGGADCQTYTALIEVRDSEEIRARAAGWTVGKFGQTEKWWNPSKDDGARYIVNERACRNICEDYGL